MSDTDTYIRKYWEICDLLQSFECSETQKHILSFMHWLKKKVIYLLFFQTVVQIANNDIIVAVIKTYWENYLWLL